MYIHPSNVYYVMNFWAGLSTVIIDSLARSGYGLRKSLSHLLIHISPSQLVNIHLEVAEQKNPPPLKRNNKDFHLEIITYAAALIS